MRTFNDIEYKGRVYDFTKVYNVIEIFPTHDLARLTPGDILALLQCSVHVVQQVVTLMGVQWVKVMLETIVLEEALLMDLEQRT